LSPETSCQSSPTSWSFNVGASPVSSAGAWPKANPAFGRSRFGEGAAHLQADTAGTPRVGMKNVVNDLKHQTEKSMIKEALSASGWNRRRAAINLNISYRALLYNIQQHSLTA
jgi:DNA-binding NtrC family response regulator